MILKMSTAAAALIAAMTIAGAASAQSQANPSGPGGADQASPAAAAPADPNAAPAQATPASSTAATDTTGYNVGAPQTDPNTGAQIVTNGPVPDTAANRAAFGKPDSHAGRRTAPAGN